MTQGYSALLNRKAELGSSPVIWRSLAVLGWVGGGQVMEEGWLATGGRVVEFLRYFLAVFCLCAAYDWNSLT